MSVQVAKKIQAEVARTPARYRPLLLKLVHSFRESVTQNGTTELTAAESLRQALREAKLGKTRPVEGLWERVGL